MYEIMFPMDSNQTDRPILNIQANFRLVLLD